MGTRETNSKTTLVTASGVLTVLVTLFAVINGAPWASKSLGEDLKRHADSPDSHPAIQREVARTSEAVTGIKKDVSEIKQDVRDVQRSVDEIKNILIRNQSTRQGG